MNILSLSLIVLCLFLLLSISCAGRADKQIKVPETIDSRLQACPDKPNCINTEYPDKTSQYIPPLYYPKQKTADVISIAKEIIVQMGGQIVVENSHYLSAEFSSSLFRFVDDFEVRRSDSSEELHIRSASRLGYSDFGVNKRRVIKFSTIFKTKLY